MGECDMGRDEKSRRAEQAGFSTRVRRKPGRETLKETQGRLKFP
jgi:hypothetical protein